MAKKKAAAKEVERKVLSNGVILIKYDDGSYALLTPISAEDAEDIFGGEAEDSEDEEEEDSEEEDEDEDEEDSEDEEEDEDEEDQEDVLELPLAVEEAPTETPEPEDEGETLNLRRPAPDGARKKAPLERRLATLEHRRKLKNEDGGD